MKNQRIVKWTVLGVAVIATLVAGYQALGGRTGLALLGVRLFLRENNASFRDIRWQQGPTTPAQAVENRPPNIVLIVVDDLGYADLTLHGGGIAEGRVPTPNIDRIARDGVSFDTAYSGNATCAPSRAAIMTGRYATRFGFEFTPTPKAFMKLVMQSGAPGRESRAPIYHADREANQPRYEDMGLPTTEITIARLLKSRGYYSAHIGKWHLGDSPQFRSYAHGFDESLSHLHAASMYLPTDDPRVVNAIPKVNPVDRFLWAAEPWGVRFNDGEVFKPDRYMTDYLTDHALRVIESNRNRPFFLYLAYNAPHTPLQATREDYDALPFITDQTLRVYAAMIRSLDRNIGRVLQALRDQGVEQNTLVIFTSDNGAPHYIDLRDRNAPLRGWKATYFEGGIRVPLLMRWPAGLPADRRVSGMAAHFDIFATIAAAAGQPVPTDRPIDGVDLLPFARGTATTPSPHERLFWRTEDYLTMREGPWKLQVTQRPRKDWLYDLATDPGERSNLAAREPDRVVDMKAAINRFNAEQAKPIWESLGSAYVPIDKILVDPPAADDEYVYFAN
jgi:arylsulfatase A-like enzyme